MGNSSTSQFFIIFFTVVLIISIFLWIIGISSSQDLIKYRVNPILFLCFAAFVVIVLNLIKKPLKLGKKDSYHPENYSDHSEMYRHRKGIK
jgi:uncharacterized membrane protein (DUF106 family)